MFIPLKSGISVRIKVKLRHNVGYLGLRSSFKILNLNYLLNEFTIFSNISKKFINFSRKLFSL